MSRCDKCGEQAQSFHIISVDGNLRQYCDSCYKVQKKEQLDKIRNSIKEPSDYEDVKHEDMSEIFWTALAEYQKRPNKKSLNDMYVAYLWAVHEDHGLSNSFMHACNWIGIESLIEEKLRTDLPEV